MDFPTPNSDDNVPISEAIQAIDQVQIAGPSQITNPIHDGEPVQVLTGQPSDGLDEDFLNSLTGNSNNDSNDVDMSNTNENEDEFTI